MIFLKRISRKRVKGTLNPLPLSVKLGALIYLQLHNIRAYNRLNRAFSKF